MTALTTANAQATFCATLVDEWIRDGVQFAYIARALTPREMQAVNNLGVPGLYFEDAERRFFPQGRTASHIIGGVDVDGNGIAGVEKYFDERLRTLRRDTLRLSLDVRVQLAMRDAVQHAITDFNGIGGARRGDGCAYRRSSRYGEPA